jgi:hypothetical protein
MIFLFPIGTAPKISRLKQSRLLILIGRERFLNGFFLWVLLPDSGGQFKQSLAFRLGAAKRVQAGGALVVLCPEL